jgi:two-component system, cell cycle sensor histidine kinase and response regulator CckA
MVFNPAAVVQSNAEVLERVLGNAIEVRWSADEHAGNVRADVDQFEQMIINLAINARDAMPEGGELAIGVRAAALDDAAATKRGLTPGDYVVLSVADTGVGMTEETRARCFEPLFTTKGLFKGTGMGLAAARRLTEESAGAITCQSALGEGTTFEVFLPSVNEEPTETFAVAEVDLAHDTATVLIVDDDDELRRFMSRILERNGYRVVLAESAEAALAVVDEFIGTFDLLVSDFVMGEMSGRDLALALQAKNPTLMVLIVSGTANQSVISELNEGSAAFLAKPFKPSELVDNVHTLLARRR